MKFRNNKHDMGSEIKLSGRGHALKKVSLEFYTWHYKRIVKIVKGTALIV